MRTDPGVPGRLSVAFVPLPNFTLVPFAGFIDVLRLSADEGDRSRPRACQWSIMASDLRPVRSSCGATVSPWEVLDSPGRFDFIVVAGGLLRRAGERILDTPTAAFIRQAYKEGVGIIGICTGSFALAEAGLLRAGSRCCVSWYHYQDLQERFPDLQPVADRLWVRDGRIITCAGGTAAIDLAATLVEAHLGGSSAQKSLHIILVEGPRSASAAQPQPPNTIAVSDARVRRAMLLMEQNLSAPLPAEALAAQVSISKRQLERLFRKELGASLQDFGRDLRLSYAVWMMTRGTGRIGDVAVHCGFADAAHFSRVFRQEFGVTPSAAQRAGATALQQMLDGWWRYRGVPGPRTPTPAPLPSTLADRRPYL